METGYVIWPEGEPQQARYTRSRFFMWWSALCSSMRGKRHCSYWPALPIEDPIRVAEQWENVKLLHRKHFPEAHP